MITTPGPWAESRPGHPRPSRSEADGSPLELDLERFRALAHRMVDVVVDRRVGLRHEAAITAGSPSTDLPPVSTEPTDPDAVLDRLISAGLTEGHRLDHPRYFGYIPMPVDPAAMLADLLLTGFGTFAGVAQAAPGAHRIELDVIEWLRTELDQPATGGGVFLPGGSIGNLAGLAAAVNGTPRDRAVVYASAETHFSVAKACATLGVELRTVPGDGSGALYVERLAAAIEADLRVGDVVPVAVAATYGTTSTGAIDDLVALRRLTDRHGLWLHLDGAYGMAAAIAGDGLPVTVDSIVVDAHKWLFCPLETTCLLVADRGALTRAFAQHAPYLADVRGGDEVNFVDLGPQTSRQARAVRLWTVLQVHGTTAVKAAITRALDLAAVAEDHLRRSGEWELLTPATLSIVTFAHRGGEAVTRALSEAARHDGYGFVSPTTVDGRAALRMCILNPATTPADITSTLDRLAELATELPRAA